MPQKGSNGYFSKRTLTNLYKHPVLAGIICQNFTLMELFFLFLVDGTLRILKYTSSIHFICLLTECWKSRRYLWELLDTQSIILESCFKMWKQPSEGVLKSNYPKNLRITIFFYIICKILEKFLCKSLFSITFYRNSLQLVQKKGIFFGGIFWKLYWHFQNNFFLRPSQIYYMFSISKAVFWVILILSPCQLMSCLTVAWSDLVACMEQ